MKPLHPSEVVVWDRTNKCERPMAAHKAASAIMAGLCDCAGEGALPIDKTLRPGDRTLGDGDGHAYLVTRFSPNTVTVMRLPDAQRMVRNAMALYVNRDGSPLLEPSIEREPALVAEESAPALEATPKAGSLLSRVAGRLAGALII